VQAAAGKVAIPKDVIALLVSWRKWCAEQAIEVSDRRWRKVVKLLQVSALSNGRAEVSVWDAWLLQHCLWEEPGQREAVYGWYADRVGASAAMDPGRLTKVVVSWEGRLKRDQESQGQQRDASGRLLYRTAKGGTTTKSRGAVQAQRDGKPLYVAQTTWRDSGNSTFNRDEHTNYGKGYTAEELATLHVVDSGQVVRFREWSKRTGYLASPSSWLSAKGDLPAHTGTTQQKPEYISASLAQVDRVRRDIEAYRAQVVDHIAEMTATIETHLWVTPDFVQPAATTLGATLASVDGLLARLAQVREGIELLPVEPSEDVESIEDDGDEDGEE
jgi:MoxR-like ATPase